MLRRIPIHRAGVRPLLFLGADRTLAMMLLVACLTLVLSWDPLAIVAAAVAYTLGLLCLQGLAKADPLMRRVYMRHLAYQRYYPARSTPFARNQKGPTSAYKRKLK
jgi:type IV secretion system protein TrbD